MKKYFPDFIFGSIDGLITTFAIVSGVVGASLSPIIIVILGFANLFADGFSMGVSNYLSTSSKNDISTADNPDFKSHHATKASLVTFLSFVIVGFVPLLAFVFKFEKAYEISIVLTAVTFFVVGYLKGFITNKNRFNSAIQTLGIGALAAMIAYFVGLVVSLFV